ncbi:hypothetical protein GQ472_01775 [archaeon]|nr:hypothetical protein [archaeon]
MVQKFRSDAQRKTVMAKLVRKDKVIRPKSPVYRPSSAVAYMDTKDGKIKGVVKYNDFYERYNLFIDGSHYGQFKNFNDGVDELKRSGFKKITIRVP